LNMNHPNFLCPQTSNWSTSPLSPSEPSWRGEYSDDDESTVRWCIFLTAVTNLCSSLMSIERIRCSVFWDLCFCYSQRDKGYADDGSCACNYETCYLTIQRLRSIYLRLRPRNSRLLYICTTILLYYFWVIWAWDSPLKIFRLVLMRVINPRNDI
jgi:hypothetical protein